VFSFDFIRDNYEVLRYYIDLKGLDTDIDYIYQLTLDRIRILKEIDKNQQKINQLNRKYLEMEEESPKKQKIHEELKNLSMRKKYIKKSRKEIETRLNELLLTIPNIPNIALYQPHSHFTMEDTLEKEWHPREYDPGIKIIPHYDMAHKLRIYDQNYTKKISAPKFMLFLPKGSLLVSGISRHITSYFRDSHFQRIFVSEVLDRNVVNLMGYAQEDRDMFNIEDSSLQLSPSGHIGILNMLSSMNLNRSSLPLRLNSLSNCFRKEIGGYGKENRGLLRMYQFIKNDSIIISDPDESYENFDMLISSIEGLIRSFEIPYRIINPSYRNIPFTSSMTLQFESFLPSLNKWVSLLSVSNTEEFLSRRISLQFRCPKKKIKDYPHILHCSGPAVERLIALILENRQYDPDFDFETLFA